MHPVLFSIGSFQIHAYGFMLALSFLFGIWLARKRARANNLDPEVINDVGFYLILSAILGARLYYVILKWDEFKGDLLSTINPFQQGQLGIGGLVMLGGFIGAIVAGYIFFKVKKLPFLPYADALAPSLGFGIFLTRIGCYLNGCCYGAPTTGACGVVFPPNSPAGHYQAMLSNSAHLGHEHAAEVVKLLPSQLFLSAGGLTIATIILLLSLRKWFDGFLFYMTGLLYSIHRFVGDFSRFYSETERIGPLSHNQVQCIILFVIFGGLILKSLVFKDEPVKESAPETASS